MTRSFREFNPDPPVRRIVDGKEAVTWLVQVKDNLEDPQRLLFDL